jgi:type 2 lantibiotic biosynthesis protein LanM
MRDGATMTAMDVDRVRRQWVAALGSVSGDTLDRRLRWDGHDPARLDAAAAALTAATAGRDKASDQAALSLVRQAIRASAGAPLLDLSEPDAADASTPFIDLWRPAAEAAAAELEGRLGLPGAVQETALSDLAGTLASRLCVLGGDALSGLFEAERGAGAVLLEQLGLLPTDDGTPARERYRAFIERHRRDGLEELLGEFPVLGRLVACTVSSWLETAGELLTRIDTDRALLSDALGVPLAATLHSVNLGVGDPHRGGRSVAILRFQARRRSWTIVYKPRDAGLDAQFQRTLAELNRLSARPPLATATIVERDGYCYMQWIERRACRSEKALRRFYYNAGRLTLILYGLGCTDCHSENLIAHGDQWILIDPETLFEPEVSPDLRKGSSSDLGGEGALRARFEDSVARLGLLPLMCFAGAHRQAFDTSALGTDTDDPGPGPRPGWTRINTDRMTRGLVPTPRTVPASSPVDPGTPNPLERHLEAFCAGFQDQGDDLVQSRRAWLAPGGFLDRFAGLPRRMVLRATRIYGAIQARQVRADALRSEFAQQLALEPLARLYLSAPERPRDWPVVAAEQARMRLLDVPWFNHAVDGTDLPLGEGQGSLGDYFRTSGLEASRRRLGALDGPEIEFQLRLVRGAVDARRMRADRPAAARRRPSAEAPEHPDFDPLETAQEIARALVASSFDDGTRWLGFDLAADGRRCSYGPLTPSLYSGSLGIAVFFACLSRSLAARGRADPLGLEERVRRLIEPIGRLAEGGEHSRLGRWRRDQPPGLAGVAGAVLALIAIDDLGVSPSGFPSARELALRLLDGLDEGRIGGASSLDLLSGATGLVGPLLRLGTPGALALADRIGERLAQASEECGPGFIGADGGLAALAALHRQAARTKPGVALAKALLCQQQRNGAALGAGWRHGLGGAALMRLCLGQAGLCDPAALETRSMMQRLANADFPDDSLGCGLAGGVAILRMAGEAGGFIGLPGLEARLAGAAAGAFRRAAGGDRPLLDHPGLMTGASGLGLVLINDAHSLQTLRTVLSAGLLDRP